MGNFPGSILLTQGDQYAQTADKRHPLGTRGYTRDGRVFRYSRAGASTLAVAKLLQAAVAHADFKINLDPATSTAPTTGSTTVTLQYSATATTLAADFFADGYAFIDDGTGAGQLVQILGNSSPTGAAAASGNIDVYLREDSHLTVAPTTACEWSITQNKYDDVIIRPNSARTSVPLGIPPRAVTATYYFWMQTWGPCPAYTGGTVIIGNPVGDSTSTMGESTIAGAGVLRAGDTSTKAHDVGVSLPIGVGFTLANVLQVGGAGEYSLVDLRIEP